MPAEAVGEAVVAILELVFEILCCITESGRQKHRDKKAARRRRKEQSRFIEPR